MPQKGYRHLQRKWISICMQQKSKIVEGCAKSYVILNDIILESGQRLAPSQSRPNTVFAGHEVPTSLLTYNFAETVYSSTPIASEDQIKLSSTLISGISGCLLAQVASKIA